MTLYCALCLFTVSPLMEENEAVTVINGQAVCADHTCYVQGGEHAFALATLNREDRS